MDYIKSTDFAVKDVLPAGDPLKKVKGTEIDTEFNNIAEAVGTKLNKVASAVTNNLPTFNNIGEIQDSGISSQELILDEDVGVSRADQIPRNEDLYRQVNVTLSSSDVTLTEAQYTARIIRLTGTLSANVNVVFPATARLWDVINDTTGNYTVTLKTSTQTSGVIVRRGETVPIRSNGTNIVTNYHLGDGVVSESAIADGAVTLSKMYRYVPGPYVIYSGSGRSASSSSPTKLAEVIIPTGGTITLYCLARYGIYQYSGQVRTYVNGVARGPTRDVIGQGTTFSENITVNPGDLVQVYGWDAESRMVTVELLQVRVGNPLLPVSTL